MRADPDAWREGLAFLTLLGLVLIYHQDTGTILSGLAVLLVARILLVWEPGDGTLLAAGLLVLPAAEALLVRLGLYRYSDAAFAGLPLWLPPWWAYALLFARRLAGRSAGGPP